jgi:hypothetical protein
MASAAPRIELLWWEGCPSTPEALAELREILREEGLDPDAVEVRRIDTEEDAGREGFVGSPTIRIEGEEVQPPPAGEPPGLTCRVYRLRDGRISPTPDPQEVRELIVKAKNGRS